MSKPSLDELILQAERTLVARHERLSRHGGELGGRLKRAAPWVLGGGLAAIMGTALLSRWIRPPVVQPRLSPAAQRQAEAARSGHAEAPWWTRWLVLVWPLVPAGVRQRLGPGEGLPLVALGLKLRQVLMALARRRVVVPAAGKAAGGAAAAAAASAAHSAQTAQSGQPAQAMSSPAAKAELSM